MIDATLPERGSDAWGSGHFGASRGSRTHRGIDYACYPGTGIHTRTAGKVTKLGYPYADDTSFRYVQVTDVHGLNHRYFYVYPAVGVGDNVVAGEIIGFAQDIAGRYDKPEKRMKNHIHYEIKQGKEYLDPNNFGIV